MFAGAPHTLTKIAVAVVVATLAACAKDDDDSSHWADPVGIVADSQLFEPAIAVTGQSTRIAVWAQRVRIDESQPDQTVVNKDAQGNNTETFVRKVSHESTRTDLFAASSSDGESWSEPTRLQQGTKVHTRTNKRDTNGKLVSTDLTGDPVDAAPKLAVAGNGDVLATWSQTDGSLTNVFAARYSAASGSWSTATEVDGSANLNAYLPQPAITAGNAPMVVFVRGASGGTGAHEVVATQLSGSTWSSPTRISAANCGLTATKTCDASRPKLAANNSGTVFVVWEQETDTVTGTVTGAGNVTATGTVTGIGTDTVTGTVTGTVIGTVTVTGPVTKSALTASRTDIYVARYSSVSWSAAEKLSNGASDARHPVIAINADGQAWAGWEQDNAILATSDKIVRDPRSVWVMPYAVASGWNSTSRTQLKAGDPASSTFESFGSMDLALDASGTVTAVWLGQQVYRGPNNERPNAWNNTDTARIWAARRTTADTAWSTPASINSYTAFDLNRTPLLGPEEVRQMSAVAPRIVLVDGNRVAATWRQLSIGRHGDAGPRVFASVFQNDTGWAAADRVSSAVENTQDVAIASSSQGHASIAWTTESGLKTAAIKH